MEAIYFNSSTGAKEIENGDLQSKLIQYKADPTLRNIGAGAMTLITGIGFNSETDGYCEISGKVKCNDSLPYWNVYMYCEGYVETERERVRNEDGSSLVATNKSSMNTGLRMLQGLLVKVMTP